MDVNGPTAQPGTTFCEVKEKKDPLSRSCCLNQNRKRTAVLGMNSMKLLKMADGGAIEKNTTRNSCSLFNKTPKEAFEGGGEGGKEESDSDIDESSAGKRGSKLTFIYF